MVLNMGVSRRVARGRCAKKVLMYSSVTRRAADDQRLGEVAGLERPATVVIGQARRWARPPLRHPQARLHNPQRCALIQLQLQ